MTVVHAREKYVSCTSAGLTAFAGAMHDVLSVAVNDDRVIERAIKKAASVDWRKENWVASDDEEEEATNEVFFEGSIVQGGKIVSNRPSFEQAAEELSDVVSSVLPRRKAG